MADISMSLDETLELDTIIKQSSIAQNPINNITYSGPNTKDYNMKGIETHTSVFDPQQSGTYTIDINGQELSVEVTDTSAIPDGDLTQYSLTDPDNRISNITASSYDGDLSSGANDEPRLYRQTEKQSYTWTFDLTVTDDGGGQGEQVYFGWSTSGNETYETVSKVIGFRIYYATDRVIELIDQNTGINQTEGDEIIIFSLNTTYTIELDFDLNNGQLTCRVLDSNDDQLGSDQKSFDGSLDWTYQYAVMSADQNFGSGGTFDFDIDNHSFVPL